MRQILAMKTGHTTPQAPPRVRTTTSTKKNLDENNGNARHHHHHLQACPTRRPPLSSLRHGPADHAQHACHPTPLGRSVEAPTTMPNTPVGRLTSFAALSRARGAAPCGTALREAFPRPSSLPRGTPPRGALSRNRPRQRRHRRCSHRRRRRRRLVQ